MTRGGGEVTSSQVFFKAIIRKHGRGEVSVRSKPPLTVDERLALLNHLATRLFPAPGLFRGFEGNPYQEIATKEDCRRAFTKPCVPANRQTPPCDGIVLRSGNDGEDWVVMDLLGVTVTIGMDDPSSLAAPFVRAVLEPGADWPRIGAPPDLVSK